MSSATIEAAIRDVPDFPQPGIIFKDITPVLRDPLLLQESIRLMTEPWQDQNVDVIVGIDARGFIFGTAMACALNVGFVPVRKKGKLPWQTVTAEYSLEYGTNAIEMHRDAVGPGQRVLLVDDLLATGGTAAAAADLIEGLGADLVGVQFLIELAFLNGRTALANRNVNSVVIVE